MTRHFSAYVFLCIPALVLAGCLVTTQEAVKKSAQSKPDAKEISSDSESKKSQSGRSARETADEKIATPKKRTKTGKGGTRSEEQEVKIMAKDLARTYPNVKKAKICYDSQEDEWWITLYEDQGFYCELRQYAWSFTENALNKFLRVERVSKKKLAGHLAKKEPRKSCQVLEIEAAPAKEPSVASTGKTSEGTGGKTLSQAPKRPLPPKKTPSPLRTVKAPKKPRTGFRNDREVRPPPKRKTPAKTITSPAKDVETPRKLGTGIERPKKQARRAELRPPAVKHPVAATQKHVESERGSGATPSRSENTRISKKMKPVEREVVKRSRPARQASRGLVAHSDYDTPSDTSKSPPSRKSRSAVPTFHVFVYGSSMKHPDLLAWLEANGYDSSLIVDAKPAKLRGYDYVWNYYSPSRDGGAVNLEPKRDSSVRGLLIECEDSLLKAFDEKEGHPSYYVRGDKRVRVERVEDGATVFAWLYLAKPNKGKKRDIWPTEAYKEIIVEGASFWSFPEHYIERLKKWKTR
jgi:gamma-glutamylcyclotransferase (GGCT)/AIG2-like uncharacterized protein YtfP